MGVPPDSSEVVAGLIADGACSEQTGEGSRSSGDAEQMGERVSSAVCVVLTTASGLAADTSSVDARLADELLNGN